MKIDRMRIFKGRNIYSHSPCIRVDIDLESYWDTPTCDIPNFNNLLLEIVPTLKDHKCSRGYKEGFIERLYEGTYMGHVIEHITIEIQSLLGYDVAYGKARKTSKDHVYYVVYEYQNEVAGTEAIKIAVALVNDLCKGIKQIDFNDRLNKLKRRVYKLELGPSTLAIKKEAEKRGIPVLRIGEGSLLQLGYGKYSKRVQATITENTHCIPVDISTDKTLTKEILSTFGVPVAEGYISSDPDDIIYYANKIGYPVVVKPNNSNQGKGVSVDLKSDEETRLACNIAKNFSEDILVEKYIKGKHYRVLVVKDEVVAVAERIAAYVVGNGKDSIRRLIEIENNNPLRGEGHERPLTKIKVDSIMELFLQKNNKNLDTIPELREVVFLRENDNLSTGGTANDVTDTIHPINAEMAIRAVKAVGLDVAGVDITTEGIDKSMVESNGVVIEVNAAPGIRMHHYPTKGKQQNVAKAIVDMLYPPKSKYTIPIISVTGTNGKTTTTRMIARILKEAGYIVGMTCTGGTYINDTCMQIGDNTGPLSAHAVLMDRRVEAAVLETARGGLVNRGLGYDLADVGIITNITEDHLGIDDINTLEEMSHIKALVAEAVKHDGYAVLNGDDEHCVKIGKGIRGKVIYYSLEDNSLLIKKHIQAGGKAVYVRNSTIYIYNDMKEIKVMTIRDIPATLDGKVTYNLKNSLAAIAGAFGMGIGTDKIRKSLKTFENNEAMNPGRFNIHQVKDFKVVVDYGHNIDGYKEVIASLKKLNHNRLIGVIGVPGDRTETSTVKIGQLCGENLDYVIIKEDKDLRGRKPGEVARFLKNGCQIGGISKENIKVELSEEKALKQAMLMAERDDVIVAFYEDYLGIIGTIEEVKALINKKEVDHIKEHA